MVLKVKDVEGRILSKYYTIVVENILFFIPSILKVSVLSNTIVAYVHHHQMAVLHHSQP